MFYSKCSCLKTRVLDFYCEGVTSGALRAVAFKLTQFLRLFKVAMKTEKFNGKVSDRHEAPLKSAHTVWTKSAGD